MPRPLSPSVTALYIIYDADGTIAGEVLYAVRKTLGIGHCSACDITHGRRAEKPEFTRLKSHAWDVPLVNVHRDEMPPALAAAVPALPAVAARLAHGGFVTLLAPAELDDLEGDVARLEVAVNAALAREGLEDGISTDGSSSSSDEIEVCGLDAGARKRIDMFAGEGAWRRQDEMLGGDREEDEDACVPEWGG